MFKFLRFPGIPALKRMGVMVRTFDTNVTEAKGLMYKASGPPETVLKEVKMNVFREVKNNNVLISMLAAPVNPADINMIQGVYPIRPDVPAFGGNEGVAQVLRVGPDVKGIKEGDWVIPRYAGFGTWRTHAVIPASELRIIPDDIPVIAAATIVVNPCTAYRMLKDFLTLSVGDTVIQNGANSAVGQAVIQIAAQRGLKTINIVRDREDIHDLKEMLMNLGATVVLTEEELRHPETKHVYQTINKPKLALNCVGGKNATEILRKLSDGGVMVSYGGMSRQPVTVPVGALIFQNITLRGFWMSEWNHNHMDSDESNLMMNELCDMIRNGTLKLPEYEMVHFSDYKLALKEAQKPKKNKKFMFYFDERKF